MAAISCALACSTASIGTASAWRGRRAAGGKELAVGNCYAFAPLACGVVGRSSLRQRRRKCRSIECNAAGEASSSTTTTEAGDEGSWVPVIPTSALPRGERRLIRQDGENVLLLWYKEDVYALENQSPAEGAYSEGMFNARLTPDGCIICPSTETTFDLKTGAIRDWYPTNPILAFLTRPTRQLDVYPVKLDSEYVYINMKNKSTGESAEIVFGGQTQAGKTATDVNVDEVKMVVDENEAGFGFTPYTELVNGRAAMVGFSMLLITELVSGKGFLKGIGFLDFLYRNFGSQ